MQPQIHLAPRCYDKSEIGSQLTAGGEQRTKYVLHNSTVAHGWNYRSKRGRYILVICIGTGEIEMKILTLDERKL
jgi:hypothetical protein